MSSASASFSPDALIAHRNFIQAIANALLRDAHGAEDVVQEVLTSSWQSAGAGRTLDRGWFATVARNFARNRIRSSSRLAARERAVAESEATADTSTLERVETGHRVVSAVLALEQPYRQVILLRYFEDLSPSQIAQRLASNPSTVRAQLTRAHEKLREKLEPEFGSQRALVLALVPLAKPAGLKLSAGLIAFSTLGLLATGTTLGLLFSGSAVLEPPAAAPVAPLLAASAPIEPQLPPVVAVLPGFVPVVREGVPQLEPQQQADIHALLAEAAMIQTALRQKLLTPAPGHLAYAAQLGPDSGVTRILARDKFEFELREPLGLRGGGAYFSFASREHSYDAEPDLEFTGGETRYFMSGFAGNNRGYFLDLGDRPLESLPTDAETLPTGLDDAKASIWKLLRTTKQKSLVDQGMRTLGSSSGLRCRANPGHTYLLRSMLDDTHDIAVLFRTLDSDANGFTIAWRVLERFEEGRSEFDFPLTALPAVEVSNEIASLDVDPLLARLAALRKSGDATLLTVTEEQAQIARSVAGDPTASVSRILPRGKYDAVTSVRGGGCYLSFLNGSNDYDHQPSIELQRNEFSSGFYGGTEGVVLDLEDVSFAEAVRLGKSAPMASALFGIDVTSAPSQQSGSAPTRAESLKSRILREQIERLGHRDWGRGVRVDIGHTYAVRKVSDIDNEPSVMAFFQPTARDEFGALTIVWKVIETH